MWQRAHTLYLAIATILTGALFFSRFATIPGPDGAETTIGYWQNVSWLIFLISILSANGTCLLSFRSRLLQLRLAVICVFLQIGFQILVGVYFFRHIDQMHFSVTAVFPLVAAILDVMAARSVAIDEAMVQSASRLRSSRRKRRR